MPSVLTVCSKNPPWASNRALRLPPITVGTADADATPEPGVEVHESNAPAVTASKSPFAIPCAMTGEPAATARLATTRQTESILDIAVKAGNRGSETADQERNHFGWEAIQIVWPPGPRETTSTMRNTGTFYATRNTCRAVRFAEALPRAA